MNDNANANRPRIGAHIRIDKVPEGPMEDFEDDNGVACILACFLGVVFLLAGLVYWGITAARAEPVRDRRVYEAIERAVPPWYAVYGAGAGERIIERDKPAGPNACGPRKWRVTAGRAPGEPECIGR